MQQPLADSPRQMRAVTAGRMWDPAKNLALLRAADLPISIEIAGETDGEVIASDRLRWVGQLGTEALQALFRESALYICCSRYEPFGLAALEAALCGCAVLAYDIPSLREVWGNGALYFHDAVTLSSLLATWLARTLLCYKRHRLGPASGLGTTRPQQWPKAIFGPWTTS